MNLVKALLTGIFVVCTLVAIMYITYLLIPLILFSAVVYISYVIYSSPAKVTGLS